MAEHLVSAVIEQLVSFTGQQLNGWSLFSGIEGKVASLTSNLQDIQAVLVDAERRQIKDASVRNWLCRLKEVSFQIDAVLDQWNTAVLGSKNSFLLHYRVAREIEELKQKLDNISSDKERYNFTTAENNRFTTTEPQRPKTTSFDIKIEEVFGREVEKEILVTKLRSKSSEIAERGHEIIPVVGAGGIGKTTLAQLVYNNKRVDAHFDLKIWVCVSDPFNEITIARAIVESLRIPNSHRLVEFQTLLEHIHESISGKRFLLVLDDVWAEDDRKWKQLENSLKSGGVGSKILVTTRKKKVAIMMGAEKNIINIEHLSNQVCWTIFFQIAFLNKDKCEELEEIGKEIAQKSKGLPLVAKTLGSLMRFKKYTKEDWRRVLHSELWQLKEIENEVFVPLLLSYYDMPPLEKRCFLFTCCFPKDHAIDRDNLIQLWLSEGYLNIKEDYKRKGIECFENIVMRSLFQDFETDKEGDIVRCKMHDIVHDFVLFLSKNEWLNVLLSSGESAGLEEGKAFHCTLVLEPAVEIPLSLYNKKCLRTLSVRNLGNFREDKIVIRWDLLRKLTCLRTLDLHDCGFTRVPKDIEKLVHLRYLSLYDRRYSIKLPESLCNLINLQTLKLSNCRELPEGIHKLVNLRHLYLYGPIFLPKSLGKNLATLNQFSVCSSNERKDKERHMMLEDLNKLTNLEGSLRILGIGGVEDVGEAERAQIKRIEGLDALTFNFSDDGNGGRKSTLLLEGLQPHPNLKHLAILSYHGTRLFPSWMTSLINLKSLVLGPCPNCECLGPFGKLLSLESLTIRCFRKVKRVGLEFLRIGTDSNPSKMENCSSISFPKLKHLQFSNMDHWEEWESCIGHASSTTIMPSLVSLKIYQCPQLKAPLPEFLQRIPLQTLSIGHCPNLEQLCREGMRTEELVKILTAPNTEISISKRIKL